MRIPKELLDAKLCQAYKVVALNKRNNRLIVATADPTDQEAAEKIKFTTQMGVDWIIAEHDKLIKLIDATSKSVSETLDTITSGGDFEFDDIPVEEASESNEAATTEVEDAPIVKFLHKMLLDAFNMRASDLHFEPYEHHYRVRFRIDGELREIASPPIAIKEKLASRIKVISRLDISEKRVPQDGRMKLKVGPDRVIDFRVSTLPTLFGEKIVIRILDPSSAKLGIDALGYEPEEKERLLHAIGRPYGMILVTGPTGSGKTVSLYTCLNLLNKPGVNIATAEDPSEINLPGVNQVNVNEKAGLTFATALKAFLRQDPDIIMVGEIRDLETADISIKAAQTGHLVLSTLHTNDAPTTLTRMRNMGIAPFNIASSVILITAQRLARRLCPNCKAPADIPHETLLEAGYREEEIDGSWVTYKPVGCSACNNGYKGRVGIYQVMPVSEETQRIILRDGSALEIAEQARLEGVRSLRESGLHKAKIGLTSLEEVLAVTNE
ncbi:type II secretory pathway, ATPase PulE/Tfp pilus assembly pathway, ATPase PilB [Acidovorax sp. MR-S7]|nr:type II secretory pathway, ATPase PulE/Tfp pilus assembly pathway, ATPase PilB [Acidovorax sp. MR-S7]